MWAEEVKALRKKLGMSQQKFAEEVGVSISTIGRWESGIGKPLPIFVEKINEIKNLLMNFKMDPRQEKIMKDYLGIGKIPIELTEAKDSDYLGFTTP